MIEPTYIYRAALLPPVKQAEMDGDTWWMDVDLGMRAHLFVKIRLRNYSCPERMEPGGVAAKEYTLQLLYGAAALVIQTHKDRLSYDRWVADVYADGALLGPLLVAAGHATYTPQ